MNCPVCGADDAYIGASKAECRNPNCRCFSMEQAKTSQFWKPEEAAGSLYLHIPDVEGLPEDLKLGMSIKIGSAPAGAGKVSITINALDKNSGDSKAVLAVKDFVAALKDAAPIIEKALGQTP